MLDPRLRAIDEQVADRMLAMRTYLENGGLPLAAAVQLTASAFTGSAMPFLFEKDLDEDDPPPFHSLR